MDTEYKGRTGRLILRASGGSIAVVLLIQYNPAATIRGPVSAASEIQ